MAPCEASGLGQGSTVRAGLQGKLSSPSILCHHLCCGPTINNLRQHHWHLCMGFSPCYTVYQCLKHFYTHLASLKCWGQNFQLSSMMCAVRITVVRCLRPILSIFHIHPIHKFMAYRGKSAFFLRIAYKVFFPRNKAETHIWDQFEIFH